MQKAAYFDGSSIYSGYPYQCANGLGYDASQQQYLPALQVESDYPQPVCSLQSPVSADTLSKPNDITEDKLQCTEYQTAPTPNTQPTVLPSSTPTQNASDGQGAKTMRQISPTSATRKHIFPWMKESRQNTKQKCSSTNSGTTVNLYNKLYFKLCFKWK